ncbi:hypothetical protein CPC08DRAFT_626320 [Agrocybe pediades]|nr:hypothetical protein CPC08DRAFT_626320 [Agrocybe pediades]
MDEVITISSPSNGVGVDDEEDEEMKSIMAQIAAQEESERLARKLQNQYDSSFASGSGSKDAPIDLEDDAALARMLADEWAKEDGASSDIEIVAGPSQPKPQINNHRRTSIDVPKSVPTKYQELRIRPEQALQRFKELFTGTKACSKCKAEVKSPRGCVTFSDGDIPPTLTYLLHASCSSCRTNHCRGCFTSIDCPIGCKGPSKNPKCAVIECCAEVRAIAIFETLGGFDRLFITERAAADSRALAIAKASTAKVKTVGPGGTGYGRGDEGHYGDYDDYYDDYYSDDDMDGIDPFTSKSKKKGTASRVGRAKPQAQSKRAKNNSDAAWEHVVLHTLNILATLLPMPYAEEPKVYDLLPHPSIGHLLSLSQIPTLLATLLRNDSVNDWISRKETYNAMLSVMRRLAECELTIHCLIGSHWESSATCGLENWMWGDGQITWTTNLSGEVEAAPPLYAFFKKLTKQSEAFLAGAMHMLEGGDADPEVEETMMNGTSLCGDIIAARDELERAIAILGQPVSDREDRVQKPADEPDTAIDTQRQKKKGKGKGKSNSGEASVQFDKVYAELCERLSFKHVSLADGPAAPGGGLNYASYYYAQQLASTQNATRLPKSRFHLLKELAITATSLPPGVWVRVDEVRNDAIKIMIAGPDGTPYAGGLFEFDCFMPIDYPRQPPLMHLRTTGGGSVRFNPNLYNDGKVCLSLLGTWPGRPEEQWSPQSTLLQVLVSIQSMILIDAPYYNEPGHGQANLKAPVSISYNREISLQTVRWAIVDWLDDKHRDGIWRDVIASHFTHRKDKIRQQIVEWNKTDPSIRSYVSKGYGKPSAAPRRGGKGKAAVKPTQSGMDLLDEFDKGIKVIEAWIDD